MAGYKIVSGDSHVTDPADLWTTRLPNEFRDRAPRIVKDPPGEKGDRWVCEEPARHNSIDGLLRRREPG